MTDEYRQKLAQDSGGSSVPCDAVDFAKYLRMPITSETSFGLLSMPLQLAHAPAEVSSYPTYFVSGSHNSTIDRWYRQSSPSDELIIGATPDGDTTADESITVASGGSNTLVPAGRLTSTITYHLIYRRTDLKVIGYSVDRFWFFYAIAPGQVNVPQLVPEAKPVKVWAPFERQVAGYTVCDYHRNEWALIANSRVPGIANVHNATPEEEAQAATISKVAILYQQILWSNIPTAPPFVNRIGQVDGGISWVLAPVFNFAGGASSVIEGFHPGFDLVDTVIPVSSDNITKWRTAADDVRFPSSAWLRIYLLGTVTGDRVPPNFLVIRPERIVATSFSQYSYSDDSVASHPTITLQTPEVTLADYDITPAIDETYARGNARLQELRQRPKNLWPGK